MSTRRLCKPSLSVVQIEERLSLGVQSRGIAAPISQTRLEGRAFVCVRVQTRSASRGMCAHARSWMERAIRNLRSQLPFHLPPSSTTPTPSPVHLAKASSEDMQRLRHYCNGRKGGVRLAVGRRQSLSKIYASCPLRPSQPAVAWTPYQSPVVFIPRFPPTYVTAFYVDDLGLIGSHATRIRK